uniref:G_PROTEIN_RECEP_F1_2 domain-containing protein n=1 Tax=Caenorhabditis tropicalis TaxID=1561998 RepID=A0A1I7TG16_9PELO
MMWSETNTISPPVQFLSMIVFYISGFCYYSNSAANPILYNILSQKYRRAFSQTILGDRFNGSILKWNQTTTRAQRCFSSAETENKTLMTASMRLNKPKDQQTLRVDSNLFL